jgi:hypothetical protein
MFTTYEVTLDAGSTDVIVLRLGKTQFAQQTDDDNQKGSLQTGYDDDDPISIMW